MTTVEALAVIEGLLHEKHRGLLHDIWRPLPKDASDTRAGKARESSLEPSLLFDDGNLLAAVFIWTPAMRDATPLRKGAHRLRHSAVDAGMHRLVVAIVLPETDEAELQLHVQLEQQRVGSGELRVLVLPHAGNPSFHARACERLAAIGPLPARPFLHEVNEADLAAGVLSVLSQTHLGLATLAVPLAADLATFLREGSWPVNEDFPGTRVALKPTADRSVVNKGAE